MKGFDPLIDTTNILVLTGQIDSFNFETKTHYFVFNSLSKTATMFRWQQNTSNFEK